MINSRYSLQVIQIYAPTCSHDDLEVEEPYEEVTRAMDRRQSHYEVVMGDFNAKIGRHQQSDGATTGMHGLGERNERGEMMVQFATSNGLTIANTMFKKPANGEVKNEIDFILVNKKEIMLNIEVINTVNIGSDHRMIRSTVKMNTKMERSRMVKASAPKINIEGLLQKREEFQIELSNRFEILGNEIDDVEESAAQLSDTIQRCAEKVAGKVMNWKKEKLKSDTKALLKKRREMKE